MARFTKNTSTFIQKKRHQLINGGSIIERDWTTLGERNVIEPGKQRVYGDSGFLFTESTRPGIKKKARTSGWSEIYTKDDLSLTVNGDINILKLPDGQDIRNYAYYGSAVEMLRATLENIINKFPAKAWTTGDYVVENNYDEDKRLALFSIHDDTHHNYRLKFDKVTNINSDPEKGEINEPNIWAVVNPFNFKFCVSALSKDESELRDIPYSWNRYYINGCKILSYKPWVKQYDQCDDDYTVIYDATVTYEVTPSVSKYNEFYGDYGVEQDEKDCVTFDGYDDEYDEEDDDDCLILTETNVKYHEGHIYGLKKGDSIIWCTDIKGFTIMPMPNIITSYFNNLDGFERLLLNKSSEPIYTCTLKTPKRTAHGLNNYLFVNRKYKFPSFGYCILCNSVTYDTYVNHLYNLAEIMDEEFSDNIWRNMTHESIKNFDWSYRKEFEDGDADDNIFGGTRLKDVLRIYGRFFDDIKRYIDNIKVKNNVTYDAVGNFSVYGLSDKAQLSGWEVYSTKLNDTDNLLLTSDYVNTNVTKQISRWLPTKPIDNTLNFDCDTQANWFTNMSPDTLTQNDVDNYFMRMLSISAPHIFRRKGTKHAIEMLYSLFGFGENDYTIDEYYYYVEPKDADEIVYAYILIEQPFETFEYKDVSDENINTLTEYVNSLTGGVNEFSEQFITINGEYYELTQYTLADLCAFLNTKKIFEKNYPDDIYSGVPLGIVNIGPKKCIVPYFTPDKIYDGNVQFQTNGGWCSQQDDYGVYDDYEQLKHYDYKETLPYTTIVHNIEELLNINMFDIKGRRLFYVEDISGITKYVTDDYIDYISHYFKIDDPSRPDKFESWKNIPINKFDNTQDYYDFCNESEDDESDDSEYVVPKRPLFYGVTEDDYFEAQYIDNLVMDNIGNNPHTGLGKYDLGTEYVQYLERPFLYSEKFNGFNHEYLKLMAEHIRFVVYKEMGDKIIINKQDELKYYLPSKVLVISNKSKNRSFDQYFNNVILKYLTQIIPSTTILIFC